LAFVVNPIYIIWFGAVINLLAGLHYTYSTVRSPTNSCTQPKPNPISWGIWSLSGWLAFFGQITEGVRAEAILTLCVAAVPTFIFAAATVSRRRYGAYAPVTRTDFIYGGCALAALAAWRATESGSLAVALSIVCDVLVAVPVVRQAYHDPASDSPSIWVAGAVNGMATLVTLRSFTFLNAGFALYFVGLCLILSFLLVVRPRLLADRSADSPDLAVQDFSVSKRSEDAAAFAGAFVAEFLSWDEADRQRRAAALSAYIDRPADALWGWSGLGRQQADLVLVGPVELTSDGYYVVDVRARTNAGPDTREVDGRVPVVIESAPCAEMANEARRYAHEVAIPLPGSALRTAVDPAAVDRAWSRLHVPVLPRDGRFIIPT
jgi:hypothetical protein